MAILNHPFFSPAMDDRLSLFFLGYSKSISWLVFGFGALVTFIVIGISPIDKETLGDTFLGKVAIGYSVVGGLLTWLAAQAHARKSNRRGWVISIFLIWPLAYWYLVRELFANK